MTPDELNAIDEESRLVALCIGPDEPDWMGCDDCTWTALDWLAVRSHNPELGFHGGGNGWIAMAGIGSSTLSFRSPSPWLALLKLVAAVQLHKRGELEL